MRFMVGDATQLDLPAGNCDVVFSNWLLMYLSDEECAKLAADALTWVRPLLQGTWPSIGALGRHAHNCHAPKNPVCCLC